MVFTCNCYSTNKQTMELTINNLGLVHEEMFEARAEWYYIGLKLRVRVDFLDSIRSQFSSPKDLLRETLKEWLKTTDDTTWKALVKALRSPVITEDRLAARLESKFCVDPQVVHGEVQRLNQQMKELEIEIHQMKQQLERHLQASRTIIIVYK